MHTSTHSQGCCKCAPGAAGPRATAGCKCRTAAREIDLSQRERCKRGAKESPAQCACHIPGGPSLPTLLGQRNAQESGTVLQGAPCLEFTSEHQFHWSLNICNTYSAKKFSYAAPPWGPGAGAATLNLGLSYLNSGEGANEIYRFKRSLEFFSL